MPELTLSEDHRYSLDGRRIIGVTEALKVVDTRYKADPWYLQRGRAIHHATALSDRGTLDEDTVDPQIAGYLESYKAFRTNTDFEPVLIEQPLYHPQYLYAGTLDRQGPLNGVNSIIDLKSGVRAAVDELQEVAYWELCRVNDIPAVKLFDLYLDEKGKMPDLRPAGKPAKNLLPVFLACLKIAQWREDQCKQKSKP